MDEIWTLVVGVAGRAGGEDPITEQFDWLDAKKGKSRVIGVLKDIGVPDQDIQDPLNWRQMGWQERPLSDGRTQYSTENIGWFFEIVLDRIPTGEERIIPSFTPFSRFPLVERDLSLLVSLDQSYGNLQGAMAVALRKRAGEAFQDLRCVDVFRHKNLPSGRQAWLVRMRFQAMDRTLASAEVDAWVAAALEAGRSVGAELRS